jgi:predicted alpha-1,2-mannosidase
MKYRIVLIFTLLAMLSCKERKEKALTQYVNPFIGTANANVGPKNLATNFTAANVYPGAVVPWGMVSISPHNTFEFDKSNQTFGKVPSGYIYGEQYICGFGQLHLSGTGCNEWGNILIMPAIGKPAANFEEYKSTYKDEIASPGYYHTFLNKPFVETEVSATTRSTLSKYTFTKSSDSALIVFDLYRNMTASKDAYIRINSSTEVEGWNANGGLCGQGSSQKVYFIAVFSKPALSFGTTDGFAVHAKNKEEKGKLSGAFFRFNVENGENILVKIGISFISNENARLNLNAEQPGWDFDRVKENARLEWEKQLSKIKVEGGTEDQKTIFYTALYHALIHPSIYNDVNGEYLSMGTKQVRKLSPDRKNQFTVFSLWDTYRNLHSLLTLVYPEMQLDMVKTMVDQYKEGGYLPKWELASNETNVMVGDPACVVIADTYLKGLQEFDINKAYEGMIKSSTNLQNNNIRPGLAQYMKYGYVPFNKPGDGVWGPTSTSLEYYMADFAIAQLAKSLGKDEDHKIYMNRALNYQKLFDPKTSFIRPKNEDGTFLSPFNPDTIRGSIPGATFPNGGPGFVEGNAWQYTFMVPFDIKNYAGFVGKEKFIHKLQACFVMSDRFVLFNEPDMCYPYLFDYLEGEGWRTQKEARAAMSLYYGATPGGLPGNDDCGVLSAWYIFSAMGFYPACPGTTQYQLGSPVFNKITIQLDRRFYSGNEFVIESTNNSQSNLYVHSILLNGKSYNQQYIEHSDIVKGGRLLLNMDAQPLKGKN